MYGDDAGWYSLLERVSNALPLDSKEALELAVRGRQVGRQPLGLPLAMAHWLEGRYGDALASLLEPSVVEASDSLWVYHNLVGMVARKLEGERDRAAQSLRTLPPA